MRIVRFSTVALIAAATIATPAMAATAIPGGSNLSLFLIGVAGLVVGRRTIAKGAPRDDRNA